MTTLNLIETFFQRVGVECARRPLSIKVIASLLADSSVYLRFQSGRSGIRAVSRDWIVHRVFSKLLSMNRRFCNAVGYWLEISNRKED